MSEVLFPARPQNELSRKGGACIAKIAIADRQALSRDGLLGCVMINNFPGLGSILAFNSTVSKYITSILSV